MPFKTGWFIIRTVDQSPPFIYYLPIYSNHRKCASNCSTWSIISRIWSFQVRKYFKISTTIFIPSATRTWPTNLSSPCIFHPSLPSNISLGINLSWKRTKLVHRVLYEVSRWRILGKILLFRGRKFWSKKRKISWFYRGEENNSRDNER